MFCLKFTKIAKMAYIEIALDYNMNQKPLDNIRLKKKFGQILHLSITSKQVTSLILFIFSAICLSFPSIKLTFKALHCLWWKVKVWFYFKYSSTVSDITAFSTFCFNWTKNHISIFLSGRKYISHSLAVNLSLTHWWVTFGLVQCCLVSYFLD